VSFDRLGLVGLLVYLLLLAGIAELARRARRDRSPADHFLAGRDLGVFVLFLTLYATAYSGNSLLGYPGEAYRRGFSWIMATGFMLSIIVTFHVLVPRLRPVAVRNGFVTPGDWVRHRFGDSPDGRLLRLFVALLMAVALSNFLFAQLKAMGLLAEQVTGGLVSYEVGVVVLAAVILGYETLGGMRAVAWTDAAQGVLMLLGLGALLFWLLDEAGGVAALTHSVASLRPEATVVPDTAERANWASTIVLLGLASVVYPQAIQRVYAARNGATLRRAFALMSFMPLSTTLVVTLIGLAAMQSCRRRIPCCSPWARSPQRTWPGAPTTTRPPPGWASAWRRVSCSPWRCSPWWPATSRCGASRCGASSSSRWSSSSNVCRPSCSPSTGVDCARARPRSVWWWAARSPWRAWRSTRSGWPGCTSG
jgi:Na+/proline symporter